MSTPPVSICSSSFHASRICHLSQQLLSMDTNLSYLMNVDFCPARMKSLFVGLCHTKPKKSVATAIVPEDYICTHGDLALIDFIKEIPCEPRVEVVLIDDAFVERKSMECLFQPNAYLGDEVFILINIRETHWYLVVINARNMEIQVLDSLGTSQDRKDLTDSDAKIIRRNFVIDLLSYEDNSCRYIIPANIQQRLIDIAKKD
ncbi:hypothetical protein ZEAMMB73_Zm00001d051446 [Zea mays]|uniref:Ubiquitin-like protease family profile domain-containing protein n=1 Tax=Zea mays TaxID=4577 RepID=A0A1D6Q6Y6_MAIZE|nr:hypothetical protein ZEAMMB73_Zm00001d051446 [Zea mays]